MKIMFIGTEEMSVYSSYDPETETKIRFLNSGESKELPDSVAERLIGEYPQLFGETEDDIKKARGVKEIKPLPQIKPNKEPSSAPSHPFVTAHQRLTKQMEKDNKKSKQKGTKKRKKGSKK